MYVNYAMVEDFKKLREMNISVSGHIVIAKYGKIYRGDKVSTFVGFTCALSKFFPDFNLVSRVRAFQSAVTERTTLCAKLKLEPEKPGSDLIVRMRSSSLTIPKHE